ncbi:MAG: DUF424 family protein [Candidatus Aenigmatarchaeota archaeon]
MVQAMFWSKIHYLKYFVIGAICDEEILGKKLKFGKIEVYINPRFYQGSLINEEEALKVMRKIDIGNLFGNKIVDLAIKNGIIGENNVLVIDGIKHAQFIK